MIKEFESEYAKLSARLDAYRQEVFRAVYRADCIFLITLTGSIDALRILVTPLDENYIEIKLDADTDPNILIAFGHMVRSLDRGLPEKDVELTSKVIQALQLKYME